jgi:hypothetical protein
VLSDVAAVRGTDYFTVLTFQFSGTSPFGTPSHEFDLDTPYIGLYPFSAFSEVRSWEASNAASPSETWHLDPAQTALRFTQEYLGFAGINQVVTTATDDGGTHVTVGYRTTRGAMVSAATIRLARIGTTAAAPWEVQGTDAGSTLRITAPSDGATVSDPHNYRIQGTLTSATQRGLLAEAFGPASYTGRQPIGYTYEGASGGTRTPWLTYLDMTTPVGPVNTVVVAVGVPESITQSTMNTTPDAFLVLAAPYSY